MGYSLDFTIEALPDTQVAAGKGHWRSRQAETKRWHKRVAQMVLASGRPVQPLSQARVRFERHSTTEPDFDNLVASFKSVRDGLVEARVLEDDKPAILRFSEYQWHKAKRGEGRIRVVVHEVTE